MMLQCGQARTASAVTAAGVVGLPFASNLIAPLLQELQQLHYSPLGVLPMPRTARNALFARVCASSFSSSGANIQQHCVPCCNCVDVAVSVSTALSRVRQCE